MNSRQKEILQSQLDNEQEVLKKLQGIYKKALEDVNSEIASLMGRTDVENLQSIVYQLNYQNALKTQINGILDNLASSQYTTISDYLAKCYENGFLGTMYDLHGQGIPLVFPINQELVVRAVRNEAQLSEAYYDYLGEDVELLKKRVANNISRGMAQGSSYAEIARNIERGMIGDYSKVSGGAMYNAYRIARTEGHRISSEAAYDAQKTAKENGADVVKQWDSTIDRRTRKHHTQLDGQLKELDEPFEVAGRKAMYPGGFGVAAEDINCRCAMLQRARWALDEDELKTLQDRAEYFGIDKTEDFEDFKKKYLDATKNVIYNGNATNKGAVLSTPMISSTDSYYDDVLKALNQGKIDYNPISDHSTMPTETEIIKAISGGDMTQGSCASVGLAYIGQKQGWNVLDFRDGDSRRFFSNAGNLLKLSQANGIVTIRSTGASSITVGNRLLKQCQNGKEYYLCVGRHAAIVRKTNQGILQYLELQSSKANGWTDFNGNPRYTLNTRFGCTNSSSGSAYWDFMIDIEASDFSTDEFKSLLGYINTEAKNQRKGASGTIK